LYNLLQKKEVKIA